MALSLDGWRVFVEDSGTAVPKPKRGSGWRLRKFARWWCRIGFRVCSTEKRASESQSKHNTPKHPYSYKTATTTSSAPRESEAGTQRYIYTERGRLTDRDTERDRLTIRERKREKET